MWADGLFGRLPLSRPVVEKALEFFPSGVCLAAWVARPKSRAAWLRLAEAALSRLCAVCSPYRRTVSQRDLEVPGRDGSECTRPFVVIGDLRVLDVGKQRKPSVLITTDAGCREELDSAGRAGCIGVYQCKQGACASL